MSVRAVANIPNYVGSFAYANLPAAASYSGLEAFCSDWGASGARVRSNGSRWLPVNGRVLLKHLGSAVSGIGSTATIVIQTPAMPAGSVQAGDQLAFDLSGVTRTGTTDNITVVAYAGTAGTTADTSIITGSNTILSSTNLTAAALLQFKIAGNTSVQRVGPMGGTGAYAGGGISVGAAPSAVTITDLSANAIYFSLGLQSAGATNTAAMQDAVIWHVVN